MIMQLIPAAGGGDEAYNWNDVGLFSRDCCRFLAFC